MLSIIKTASLFSLYTVIYLLTELALRQQCNMTTATSKAQISIWQLSIGTESTESTENAALRPYLIKSIKRGCLHFLFPGEGTLFVVFS